MSFAVLKTVSFLVLILTGLWSSVSGATIPTAQSVFDNTTTMASSLESFTTEVSTQVNQTSTSRGFNLSEPLLPPLADYLIFAPLVALNNRISDAAAGLPNTFEGKGERLGSAIASPIQWTASTANNVVTGMNETINTASKAIQPVLAHPLVWLGQINSQMRNGLMNTLNRTTTSFGQQITNVGNSIMASGANVQNVGDYFAQWLIDLNQQAQQRLNSTTNSTTADLTTPIALNLTEAVITTESIIPKKTTTNAH